MLPKKKTYKSSTNYNKKTFGVYHYNRNDKQYHITVDGKNISRARTLEGYGCLYILKPSKNSNITEEYNKRMNEFIKFKAITGFNYKRCNYNDTEMCLYIFNFYRPQDIEFGKTSELEEEWIYKASRGGIRYSKDGKYRNYVKLDLNKKYTSVLCSTYFSIPLGTPETRSITQDQLNKYHKFNYGLYNIEISKNDDVFFKYNKNNIYTHFELKQAKELGLKLKLLDNNYLYYKEKIKSIKLFGKYFHRLLPHSKSQDLVKLIMNKLWGIFQTKLRKKVNTKEVVCIDDRENEETPTYKLAPDGYTILSLTKFEEEKKYFKYYACRIAPFLTAYVRTYMTNLINEYKEHVIYSHTDSLIIKNHKNILNKFEISDELGKWKQEDDLKVLKIEKSRVIKIK